jgi:hypothetical protein
MDRIELAQVLDLARLVNDWEHTESVWSNGEKGSIAGFRFKRYSEFASTTG